MIGPMNSNTASRIINIVLLTFLSLLLILIAVYSLEWRTGYDPAWMIYDGRLIDQHHLVPYRDFHEINFPGSLYLYILIGRAIGFTNERLLRVIDLGYLGAIGLATWIWLRPLGHKIAWGAAVLFGIAYLTSDITVNIQRDYFIILPLGCAVVVASRLPCWPPVARGFLIGVLGGLVAAIKPHALIGWPVILGFVYFDMQHAQPRRFSVLLVRLGLSSLVGLLILVGLMLLYLVSSGSLSDFIELETKYVPLYSHVSKTLVIIDYPERIGYMLQSFIRFNGLWWWFIPAGIGVMSTLLTGDPGSRQRRLVWLMVGLAVCYALYPAVSGQFFNYHWLPFMYCLMALSALSLNGLPDSVPAKLRWIPNLALIAGLLLPPNPLPDTLARLNNFYIHKQPIPPTDGGVADELATYLLMHRQPEDRVQVLGSSGTPLHGLLLADALPATYFLLDLPLHHDLSQPTIQKYQRVFMSQLEQSPPRFVIDMYQRLFFIGPDSSVELPEFSKWLTQNYQLAYVGRAFSIYEHRPELHRGFVVYPLEKADVPIRYHLRATSDVLPLNRKRMLNTQSVSGDLSDFVSRYDIISAEFLAEQDPERAIEAWLGKYAFRIGEHWINATRIVQYLTVPPERLEMQTSGIAFGPSIHLNQYAIALIDKGETQWVCAHLEWSATQPLADSYKFSVRVTNQDGQVVALYDSQPAGYLLPTTAWKPGETIHDQLALPLPAPSTPDRYHVELVIYNEASGERLLISGSNSSSDSLSLGDILITN